MNTVTLVFTVASALILQCLLTDAEPLLSFNSAGWATSIADCQELFGGTSGLLIIDSQRKLDEANKLMQSDNTGSEYWIGGRYDSKLAQFVWNTGAPIANWIKWDQNEPKTKTKATRLTLTISNSELYYRTKLTTDSTRYICDPNP